ncbi:MAG: carboxypeptidase-like regulatory domain-containing protein, partial [Pseudobdellovibrionaceae bacterium]
MIFQFLIVLVLNLNLAFAQESENPPPANLGSSEQTGGVAESSTSTFSLEGVVLEKGTRKPLADVNIFILPHKLKATSDTKGKFMFDAVPAGNAEVVINLTNYNKYSNNITFDKSLRDWKIYLDRSSAFTFETVVTGTADKRDDTTRRLKQEEFLSAPGAGGDPVKAVQNLPGVSRTTGSQVIIQGAAPEDTRYAANGHTIPLVFHFGGLSSVVMPEAVESIDYLSAGYGPEYGNALGGVINLNVRSPKKDRTHALAYMDIFNMGGLIEGQINESSRYLMSARYSYIGLVFGAIAKGNDDFSLTVAPTFADITGVYEKDLGETDAFKLTTIGSQDTLGFVLKKPVNDDPSLRGEFSQRTEFYRLIPEWNRKLGSSETRLSASVGQDSTKSVIGDNYFKLNMDSISLRAEWNSQIEPTWKTYFGMDSSLNKYKLQTRLPSGFSAGGVSNPFSSGEVKTVNYSDRADGYGVYWRNELKISAESKMTYFPQLRVDYLSPTKETLPQPRMALRYELTPYSFARGSVGLYSQIPTGRQFNEEYGNPDIKASQATHYVVGWDRDFREGASRGQMLTTNLFYKDLRKLVISSSEFVTRDGEQVPERYNNKGKGRIQGAEIQLKSYLDPFSISTSYTFSQSFRTEPGQKEYPSAYDQTHS